MTTILIKTKLGFLGLTEEELYRYLPEWVTDEERKQARKGISGRYAGELCRNLPPELRAKAYERGEEGIKWCRALRAIEKKEAKEKAMRWEETRAMQAI